VLLLLLAAASMEDAAGREAITSTSSELATMWARDRRVRPACFFLLAVVLWLRCHCTITSCPQSTLGMPLTSLIEIWCAHARETGGSREATHKQRPRIHQHIAHAKHHKRKEKKRLSRSGHGGQHTRRGHWKRARARSRWYHGELKRMRNTHEQGRIGIMSRTQRKSGTRTVQESLRHFAEAREASETTSDMPVAT
jgi:hypothetical protein